METQVIIPCPRGYGDYAELSASDLVELTPRTGRKPVGTLFRKHILNLGTLIHPKTKEKLTLDEAWFDKVKSNFEKGVCDIAQVPLADAQNKHTEYPLENTGEIVGLERVGNKVYDIIDVRRPDVVQGLRDKTILGASAFLNLDYEDTNTGQRVGPTLLHHCLTNRPYVTGLDDYEEIVAATVAADNEEDVVVLSTEEPEMPLSKEELLAQLKAEHGIDVPALEAALAAKPDLSALTAQLTSALAGTSAEVKLTGAGEDGKVELSDVVGAVAELAQTSVALSSSVQALQRQGAEREIDGYVQQGRVLPKQRAFFVDLALTNRDGLEVMLPDEPVVKLSNQVGTAGDEGTASQVGDIDAEVARLAKKHAELHPSTVTRPGSALARRRA